MENEERKGREEPSRGKGIAIEEKTCPSFATIPSCFPLNLFAPPPHTPFQPFFSPKGTGSADAEGYRFPEGLEGLYVCPNRQEIVI